MKNSLKISSNFSIPWLGAFIVTCVLLKNFRLWIFIWKKHQPKKAEVTVLIAWDFSPFPIFTTSSISTNGSQLGQIRHLGAEIWNLAWNIMKFIAWWNLHKYGKGSCFWSQSITSKFQPYSQATNISRMKFGRVTSSVNAGESLENLSSSFRRSEALDKEKNQWFLYCFYISQLRCLTESAKKLWSVGWFTGVLKHHMIVQAMAAKLQWFISQPWPLEPCHPGTTT